MGKYSNAKEPVPVEQWTVKEWESAYSQLNTKYDKLKNKMRAALNELSRAQILLSEAVV